MTTARDETKPLMPTGVNVEIFRGFNTKGGVVPWIRMHNAALPNREAIEMIGANEARGLAMALMNAADALDEATSD